MQYTRRDWRNRNQIKTPNGLQWLTIPVQVKGKYHQKIRETKTDGISWQKLHWSTLTYSYHKAKYFDEIAHWLEPLYSQVPYDNLSKLNYCFIKAVCNYLSINTSIKNSWEYELLGNKSQRLANLCHQAAGTEYISGPGAKKYLDEIYFSEKNIKLTWFDYSGYPKYNQLWGDFIHDVSILDLLFNCGKDSSNYMRYIDK